MWRLYGGSDCKKNLQGGGGSIVNLGAQSRRRMRCLRQLLANFWEVWSKNYNKSQFLKESLNSKKNFFQDTSRELSRIHDCPCDMVFTANYTNVICGAVDRKLHYYPLSLHPYGRRGLVLPIKGKKIKTDHISPNLTWPTYPRRSPYS